MVPRRGLVATDPACTLARVDAELGPLRFGVVGAGALGTAIISGLQAAGHEVVGVSSRSAQTRSSAVAQFGVMAFSSAADLSPHVDVVVSCVPDDQTVMVIDQLLQAAANASGKRLIVTSGVVASDDLKRARAAGWATVVVQPLTTVQLTSTPGHSPLFGAPAMVSASSHAARTLGLGFAHALEMVPVDVEPEHRHIVAAMAALAANLPLALFGLIDELGAIAQIPQPVTRSAFARLGHMAIDRWRKVGAAGALGGPISRADQTAVGRHLAALDQHSPHGASAYRELSADLVRIAHASGALTVNQAAELSQTLATLPNSPTSDP